MLIKKWYDRIALKKNKKRHTLRQLKIAFKAFSFKLSKAFKSLFKKSTSSLLDSQRANFKD
jgi:hypothetical protein